MRQYGIQWFDSLLAQRPRWVRGTQTPKTLAAQENSTSAAFFAGFGGFGYEGSLNYTHPTHGKYVSWPQTGAILKDAPHIEGAKLLHNFILTPEYQASSGLWPVRRDLPAPSGFPDLWTENATNPAEFSRFMADRQLVERLRFFFEDRIGTAKGLDPVFDDL
jgi:ABC-type Fe3+ transport system substrate-binding protein